MISLHSRVRRNERTAWRIIEDEGVLVDSDKGNIIHLNETGAEIWKILNESRSVSEIVTHVRDTFNVDAETAERDTLEFLEDLVKNGVAECPATTP